MQDVEDSGGEACADDGVGEEGGEGGRFFGGFQDYGVACYEGVGERPEGNHEGVAEGGDGYADALGWLDLILINGCTHVCVYM